MATSAELALLFTAQGAEAVKKALKDVSGGIAGARAEAEKGGGMLGGLAKGAGVAALGVTAAGVAAIGAAALGARYALTDLVPAAEGLGDAVARASLVFKDYDAAAGDIIKDNAQVANSLGLTKEAYIASAAKLGDLLTSMNVGAESAFDMSVELTELAPKLAAFAGVEADQAMDALSKGVTGATRGLKEMGIIIPDIPKGLNDAAAAAFIYDEILKQSADATTAWADNAGDMEVQSARLSSAIHDTKAALGEALLPIISAVTAKLMDYLIPALGVVQAVFTGDWAGGGNAALDQLREKAGPLADVILHVSYAVSDVVDAFDRLTSGDPQGFWDMLGNSVYSLVEGFGALTGLDISGIIDTLFGGDRDTGDGLWQEIGNQLVELRDKMLDLWERAKEAWAGIMYAVELAKPYIVDAATLISDAFSELRDIAADVWEKVSQYVEDASPRVDTAVDNMVTAGNRLRDGWGKLRDESPAIWDSIVETVRALGPIFADMSGFLFGPMLDDMKLIWGDLVKTASTLGGELARVVGDVLDYLRGFWEKHGDGIALIWQGAWAAVTGLFKVAWAAIVGTVRVALALLRGDTEGAKDALLKGWADVLAGTKRILSGMAIAIGAALGEALKSVGGKAAEIGTAITDGIRNAIRTNGANIVAAIKGIVGDAIATAKAILGIASPSRVFYEIGEMLVAGFSGGIDRNAQKAVEAAAKMVDEVTGAAQNMIELFTALASKEAQQSTAGAAERFRTLLEAMRPFRDMLVAIGQEMRRPLKGSTTELGAITKGAEGIGKVADAIKSIADAVTALGGSIKTTTGGKGGTITETVVGIIPDEAALRKLGDRARAMLDMMRSLQDTFGAATGFVGAGGLADAVKAMADMLGAAADVDLSKAVEVTSLQMLVARNFLSRMVSTFSEPGGLLDLFAKLDEDVRAAVAGGAKDLADTVGALADIIKTTGSFTEELSFDLADMEVAAREALRVVAAIQKVFGEKGGLLDLFLRLPEKARELLADGAKQFADVIGELVKVIKLTEIGKIAPALEVSASDLIAVLTQLMVIEKYVLPDIREALKKTTEQLAEASKDLKAMADYFASIAAVLKAAEVKTIVASLEISAADLVAVLTQLMVIERYVLPDIRGQIKKTAEQLAEAAKDFKAMADWFGSIASVIKSGNVGAVESALEVSAADLVAVLTQLMVLEKYVLPDIRGQIKKTAEQLGEASKDFKAMSDWFGSIASLLMSTEIGRVEPALEISASALQNVLLIIQNLVKAVLDPMRKQLMGLGDLDGMAADFKVLAGFIGSVADILAAISRLPGVAQIPSLAADVAEQMLAPIAALAKAFADIAPDIDAAANEALASLAPATEAISKVFAAIEAAMGSAFFGSGKRARSSSSMETFKRRIVESIKAAISTLVTAIKESDIPADLATKFAPLIAAADAIRAAFDSLAKVKLPDDWAAILEAARQLAGFGGAGGPGGGGGGAMSDGWHGVSEDGWHGVSEDGAGAAAAAAAIWRGLAASLDGWKPEIGCGGPIFKAIAAELDGWKPEIGCAPPIFRAIGEQLEAWAQRGSTGVDLGGPIFKAVGEQIKAWAQRGGGGSFDPVGGGSFDPVGGRTGAFGGGSFDPVGGRTGTLGVTAQTVNLTGPLMLGMNATLNIGGGRSLSAELVDALIADTTSFDKLIKAEDRRRAQTT